MSEIILPNSSLLIDVWTPNEEEFLNRWLNESLSTSKLSDEEKSIIDGETVLGIFEGCCCVPGGVSDNDRNYPFECFFENKENYPVSNNRILQKIKSKNWYGGIGHEDKRIDEPDINNGKHAFITYKYWYDPKTKLGMARHILLNTKAGWNMYAPMKAGATWKMSSRAKGDYKPNSYIDSPRGGKVPVVDPRTFNLYNYDAVNDPGFSQTSANLLENKNNIIEVRSLDSIMSLEQTLTESLNENANLKVSIKELEMSNKSLNENLQKVSFMESLSDNVITQLKSFTNSDLENLFNLSKLKMLGESKNISFNKNGIQYDGVFIPVNLPITESRLRQEVNNQNLFESLPVDVSVINRKINPEYGSNGLVLCWSLGNRPSNLNESLNDFINNSNLFESKLTFKNEKKKCESDDMNDEMDSKDKEELNEWRTLSGTNNPQEYFSSVTMLKESLEKYTNAFGEFNKAKALFEDLDIENSTYKHFGSVEEISSYKNLYENLKDFGDSSYIVEELQDYVINELNSSKEFYDLFEQKYIDMPTLDETLAKHISLMESLNEKKCKNESDDNDEDDLENTEEMDEKKTKKMNEDEVLQEAAQRISNELKGSLSLNEAYEVIKEHGSLELAESKVFKFLRKSVTPNPTLENVKVEDQKPLHESVIVKPLVNKGRSFLGSFYDSLEVKKN